MVNAKLLVTVVAVAMAVSGAIILYMVNNNLTTDEITLYDACIGATAENEGADADQCEDFKTAGVTWNTEIPCIEGSEKTFTFQGLFDAWQLADSDANYDAVEYIDTACADARRFMKVDKRMLGEDKEDAFTVGYNYGESLPHLSLSISFFLPPLAHSLSSSSCPCSCPLLLLRPLQYESKLYHRR
jgi:hypothetical protein